MAKLYYWIATVIFVIGFCSLMTSVVTQEMTSVSMATPGQARIDCQKLMRMCLDQFAEHYQNERCGSLQKAISCFSPIHRSSCHDIHLQLMGDSVQKNVSQLTYNECDNNRSSVDAYPASQNNQSNDCFYPGSEKTDQSNDEYESKGTEWLEPDDEVSDMMSTLIDILERAKVEYSRKCPEESGENTTSEVTWSVPTTLLGLVLVCIRITCFPLFSMSM